MQEKPKDLSQKNNYIVFEKSPDYVKFVDFNEQQKTLDGAIELKVNQIDSKAQEPNALLPMGGGAYAIPHQEKEKSQYISFIPEDQARPIHEKIARYIYGDDTIKQIQSNVANGGWFDPTNMILNSLEIAESSANIFSNLVWGSLKGLTFGASEILPIEEMINQVTMYALGMHSTGKEDSKLASHSKTVGDLAGSMVMFHKTLPALALKLGSSAKILSNASRIEKAIGLGSVFAAGRTVEEIGKKARGDETYKGAAGIMESFLAGVLTSAGFQAIGMGVRTLKGSVSKFITLYQEKHLAGLLGTTRSEMKLMKPEKLSQLIDKARAGGKFNDIDSNIALRTFNKYDKISKDKVARIITGQTSYDGKALSELFQLPDIKYSKSLNALKLKDALKQADKVQGDFTKNQLRVIEKTFSGDIALTETEVSRYGETILDTLKLMRVARAGEVSRFYTASTLPKSKLRENVSHFAKFLLHKPGFSAQERKELMKLSEGKGFLSSIVPYGEKYYKNKAIKSFESTVNKAYKKLDLGKIPDDSIKAFKKISDSVIAKSESVKRKMEKILNSSNLRSVFHDDFTAQIRESANSISNLSRSQIKKLTKDLDYWYRATQREIKMYQSKEAILGKKIGDKLGQAVESIYKVDLPYSKVSKDLTLKQKILSLGSSKLETDITVMQKMFGYNSKETLDLYRYKLQAYNSSLRVTNHANTVLGKLQQKLNITPKDLRSKVVIKGEGGKEVNANANEIMQMYLLTKDSKTRQLFLSKSTLEKEASLGFEINGKQIDLTMSQINQAYSKLSPRMQNFAESLFRDINRAGRSVYENFTKQNIGKSYPLSKSYFPRLSSKRIEDFSRKELESLEVLSRGGNTVDTVKLINTQMMVDYMKYFDKRVDSLSRNFKIRGLTDAYRTYYGNLGSLVGKQKQSEVLMHAFNNKYLESQVLNKLGAEGMERLTFLKDAVYDYRGTVNMLSGLSKGMLKGLDYARGIPLFMNLNSITNQALSGVMAQSLHGAKATAKAATYSSRKQSYIEKVLRRQSPMIESRLSKWTKFGQKSRQLYVGADHVAAMERLGMRPISYVDALTIRKTSLMPAWAEGELMGLKGKKLIEWAANRASYSIDMTAPTSASWSISAMQRAMKESPILKAMFMYTSPIFKIYNYGEIAKTGLAQGKLTKGDVASTYFVTRVAMPLMYYYKGKYLSKGITGVARAAGGKDGVFYEEEELDMIDDIYGVVNSSLSSNPAFSVLLNSLGYKLYQSARGRRTGKIEAVSIDKGWVNNAVDALTSIGEVVKSYLASPDASKSPDEVESERVKAWVDAITDSIKVGAPYPAKVLKEALPSVEKSKAAYYRMLMDSVKQKDTGRAKFAISRLVKLGDYDFVVKRNVEKKLEGKKYNESYLEKLFR